MSEDAYMVIGFVMIAALIAAPVTALCRRVQGGWVAGIAAAAGMALVIWAGGQGISSGASLVGWVLAIAAWVQAIRLPSQPRAVK